MEEREEGEISEAELSDISSEEEYLLRQRLQVLENYNHVLERKEAKRRLSEGSHSSSRRHKKDIGKHGEKNSHVEKRKIDEDHYVFLSDLSELSGSDLENNVILNVPFKDCTTHKILSFPKKINANRNKKIEIKYDKLPKIISLKNKEDSKKIRHKIKNEKESKKIKLKKYSESSDETEDEYRNKRRKLAHSVQTSKAKTDQTSLKMRLLNMLSDKTNSILEDNKTDDTALESTELIPVVIEPPLETQVKINNDVVDSNIQMCESKNDALSDVNVRQTCNPEIKKNIVTEEAKPVHDSESDEDIELLRQHALQTKINKNSIPELDHLSDSEDSEELRLICLRSKVLKNKMEWRRKIKLRKKMCKISTIDDILEYKLNELSEEDKHSHNNTDIESVDMEIGHSDGPDTDENLFNDNDQIISSKAREINIVETVEQKIDSDEINEQSGINHLVTNSEDVEEDEDLLRAKLLTSLSNNLQKLYKTDQPENLIESSIKSKPGTDEQIEPEVQKFVIKIGDSDSDSENEATKNLKKMHNKLAENHDNDDFQNKLDMFLKTARKEAESKNTTKDISVIATKSPDKFVPKVVNHLPKSRQLEYQRLVKRMTELERLKQNRQAALNHASKSICTDRTSEKIEKRNILKLPNNIHFDKTNSTTSESTNLEEQIALSRQRIAAESTKILLLKEQSSKLVQKYKMVQTELRNIRTAMSLNKRNVATVQASLSQMRNQHQTLVKRSNLLNQHRVTSGNTYRKPEALRTNSKNKVTAMNIDKLKLLTVSVVNDLKEKLESINKTLSVTVDLKNNKKNVGSAETKNDVLRQVNSKSLDAPSPVKIEKVNTANNNSIEEATNEKSSPNVCDKISNIPSKTRHIKSELDDYTSPLVSIRSGVAWQGDPNAILCPFEVLGACKDTDCQYQHLTVQK